MQSSTIHHGSIHAIKYRKGRPTEYQDILAYVMIRLYRGKFDRFFSVTTQARLLALFERAHEQAIATHMAQINQMLTAGKPQQKGGKDQT